MSEEVKKHPGGRPRKYNDAKVFAAKVDEYFLHCDNTMISYGTNKGVIEIRTPYSVLGLCDFLGITRDTLCEYEKLDLFSDTIMRAKQKMELDKSIGGLIGKYNSQFTMFDLKNNFGWKDKTETELTGANGGAIEINVSVGEE